MSELHPCPRCFRHIRSGEAQCPFCARKQRGEQRGARALTAAATATLLGAAGFGCVTRPDEPGPREPVPRVPEPAHAIPSASKPDSSSPVPVAKAEAPTPDAGSPESDGPPETRMVAIYGDSSPMIIVRVQFDVGDARIREDQRAALASVAEFIRTRKPDPDDPKSLQVQIEGHADAAEKNPQSISQRRAEQVREELIKLGISPETLFVRPYGKQHPLVPSDTTEHRRINCRVSFKLGAPD